MSSAPGLSEREAARKTNKAGVPTESPTQVEYPRTGYRDAENFLVQDEGGGGASARNSVPVDPCPCVLGTGSRVGVRAPRGGDSESQPPAPCRILPSSLSPCPGPSAGLPAAASPLRSGASSPPPRGPVPGPRLRLRVTILTPAMFMPESCALHIPAAPAAPSRDSTRPAFPPRAAGNYDSQQARRRRSAPCPLPEVRTKLPAAARGLGGRGSAPFSAPGRPGARRAQRGVSGSRAPDRRRRPGPPCGPAAMGQGAAAAPGRGEVLLGAEAAGADPAVSRPRPSAWSRSSSPWF